MPTDPNTPDSAPKPPAPGAQSPAPAGGTVLRPTTPAAPKGEFRLSPGAVRPVPPRPAPAASPAPPVSAPGALPRTPTPPMSQPVPAPAAPAARQSAAPVPALEELEAAEFVEPARRPAAGPEAPEVQAQPAAHASGPSVEAVVEMSRAPGPALMPLPARQESVPEGYMLALDGLREEVAVLRKLVMVALAAATLMAWGLSFYAWRQMTFAHIQVLETRASVAEYERKTEPLVRELISRLQAYSMANPEFKAVFGKYFVPQSSPGPARPGAGAKP